MSYAIAPLCPEDKELLDHPKIHRSAVAYAHQAYFEAFSIHCNVDPQYKTGNDRHRQWLEAYDARMSSLILNPYQD